MLVSLFRGFTSMRYTITVGFVFAAFLHNVLHYINVEVVLFCLFILIVV